MWENRKDAWKQPHWAAWLVHLLRDALPGLLSLTPSNRQEKRVAAGSVSHSGEEAISSHQVINFKGTWPPDDQLLSEKLQLLQDHFTSNNRQTGQAALHPAYQDFQDTMGSLEGEDWTLTYSTPAWEERLALIHRTSHTNLSFTSHLLTNLQVILAFSDVPSIVPNTPLPQKLGTSVNEPDRCPKKNKRKENLDKLLYI